MGQNEDYSLGDSISDLSEVHVLKRSGERSVLYMILVKGEHAVKHTFWQRLAASHEEQMSPLMILVLF